MALRYARQVLQEKICLQRSLLQSLRPKYIESTHEFFGSDYYVGEEAQKMRGVLEIAYPIEQGFIKNWDDMEKIWNQVFYYYLNVDPADHPVLMTEASLFSESNRENIAQLIFETYAVPSLYLCNPAVLSLYSTGRTTGVVMECGDGISQITPVLEGQALSTATKLIPHAGRDLTNYLRALLLKSGHNFTYSTAEQEIVREIKEKICFVALDFETEVSNSTKNTVSKTKYLLPDGNTVPIQDESFLCPEFLFQPDLHGKPLEGLHKVLFNSIKECNEADREILFSSIILSGGTTMLKGMGERVYKEIRNLAQSKDRINVIAPEDRAYSSWIGGSIIAALSTFQSSAISIQEYYEEGPSIISKKCVLTTK